MKRLVLVGEGFGEASALPTLVAKLLEEKDANRVFFVDREVIREPCPVRWDKDKNRPDFHKWVLRVTLASRRRDTGGVLAIYDGDAPSFPPGSGSPFCAATAAKAMAAAAEGARAGKAFSLAVVFACVEYETWLIAGIESLAGKQFKDGRPALPAALKFPSGAPESHGKRWLEEVFPGYRPTLHQSALTEMLDLNLVRTRQLRSFQRLEHAMDQLLAANHSGPHVSTP
jgi:hypothetical protein